MDIKPHPRKPQKIPYSCEDLLDAGLREIIPHGSDLTLDLADLLGNELPLLLKEIGELSAVEWGRRLGRFASARLDEGLSGRVLGPGSPGMESSGDRGGGRKHKAAANHPDRKKSASHSHSPSSVFFSK